MSEQMKNSFREAITRALTIEAETLKEALIVSAVSDFEKALRARVDKLLSEMEIVVEEKK